MARPQIQIATRVRTSDFILEGETFEDTDILGPAVLFNMSNVTYESCELEGVVEHSFWTAEQAMISGIMGVRDCTFRRCTFRGVGWCGHPDDMVTARQMFSGES